MAKNYLRVLFIEDNEDDFFFTKLHIEKCGYTLDACRVETLPDVTANLKDQAWDVIICDYKLVGFTALDVLEIIRKSDLDIPFIVISGEIGEPTAVELMEAGAHDYLAKGYLARLGPVIVREVKALESRSTMQLIRDRLENSNRQLRKILSSEVQLKQSHLVHMQRNMEHMQHLKELAEVTAGVADDFNKALSKVSGMIEKMENESLTDNETLNQLLNSLHTKENNEAV